MCFKLKIRTLHAAVALVALAISCCIMAQSSPASQSGGVSQSQKQTSAHNSRQELMTTGSRAGAAWVKAINANDRAEEAAIDRELLPDYHKAKDLQREGKTNELDAFLMKMRLTVLKKSDYKVSRYGRWMNQTLMTNLTEEQNMKELWIAEGKPRTNEALAGNPIGEAAAAALGITYPGEYQKLKNDLKIGSPDDKWDKPFDFGDNPRGDEVLALMEVCKFYAHHGDKYDNHLVNFALRRLYYHLMPGNDEVFLALLWGTYGSNPTEALKAFHRHFPNGVPKWLDGSGVGPRSLLQVLEKITGTAFHYTSKYKGPEK